MHSDKYFQNSNFKLVDMTTYALNKYLLYELDYGKINQKTEQAEGLAVRSVRGRRSILHSDLIRRFETA